MCVCVARDMCVCVRCVCVCDVCDVCDVCACACLRCFRNGIRFVRTRARFHLQRPSRSSDAVHILCRFTVERLKG